MKKKTHREYQASDKKLKCDSAMRKNRLCSSSTTTTLTPTTTYKKKHIYKQKCKTLFIVEVLVVHMPFKVYNFNRKRFSVVVVPHLFQLLF